jgi:hypothetical protein
MWNEGAASVVGRHEGCLRAGDAGAAPVRCGLVQFGQISNVKFQVNLFLKLIDVETRGKAEAFEGQFSGCLKT